MGASTTRATRPGTRYGAARAHLRRIDPVLARLIDARPEFDPRAWLSELPPLDCFGALIFQVIGQQLSVAATRGILQRLQDSFGDRLPTPDQLLAAGPGLLRSSGLSRRKVATLRAVAEAFTDGTLDDDRWSQATDQDIQSLLTTIPGVGPWTVHGFLIVALDRPDVVLPGDLALRKVIQHEYHLDHLPSPDEVLHIAAPWRPYRSLATAYLFQSAFDRQPRRGTPAR